MNGVPEKVPFNGYYKLKPLNPKPWALNPKFRSTATMVAIGGLQEDAVAHDSDPYIRTMVQRLGTECSKGMMLFLVVGHVLMSCFLLWCVIALFLLFSVLQGIGAVVLQRVPGSEGDGWVLGLGLHGGSISRVTGSSGLMAFGPRNTEKQAWQRKHHKKQQCNPTTIIETAIKT